MDHLVKNRKTVAIIQARMGSTRLPGKVLKSILGEPMLLKLAKRVLLAKTLDEVVVATSTLAQDDAIKVLCDENNIHVFRGDSLDVLKRYYYAAKQFEAEIILRLTGDNPLIDPEIIDTAVSKFIELNSTQTIDYLSTQNYPCGLNVEVFSFGTLEKTFINSLKPYEREHVTPFMYQNSDKFNLYFHKSQTDYSAIRLTVDTPEDFELIETIFNTFNNKKEIFLLEDILNLFETKPDLISINQNVKQKHLGE
jgi:spore coat polysaccharide biosynthesis protein SpsF